jgi:hypothetical protein
LFGALDLCYPIETRHDAGTAFMIDSRYCNKNLQVVVLQTILKTKPNFKQRLTVTADAKGIVHLTGSAQNRCELESIVKLAHDVAGVTDVFCNLSIKA